MLAFGLIANNTIPGKLFVYMFIFILMQLLVILFIFEIFRKPWEGIEIELEKVLELQQNKILDDSVSSMTFSGNMKRQREYEEIADNQDDAYFPFNGEKSSPQS